MLHAYQDDPEFGHRLLTDEARDTDEMMCERSACRICRDNPRWSAFGKKPGPPVHDDLVGALTVSLTRGFRPPGRQPGS